MGCIACKCDAGLSNTGTACTPLMQVTKKVILVPLFNSTGARNKVDLTGGPFDQTFFDNLVNDADVQDRWFPLPELKNVADTRGDVITEEFEDGTKAFIREGERSFTGWFVKGTPQLKGKIEAARCVELGVYLVDKDGNLIGMIDSTGDNLFPIRIEENSVSAKLIWTTDKSIQKLELMFNFHPDEKDANLRMISCNELDFDILQLRGLLDIHSEYSSISTTGFTAKLFTEYGTPITPVVDPGLIITDFALQNLTTALPVTILTLTENPDGTYAFTFAAQSSADELELTPTKNGRDYTDVVASTIIIP